MGIQHKLDVFIVSENIAIKDANLLNGDSYGCTIKLKLNTKKSVRFVVLLEPEWIDEIKPMYMKLNGVSVDLKLDYKDAIKRIYSVDLVLYSDSVIHLFSDTDERYTCEYPTIKVNMIKKYYHVQHRGTTCVHIESPINVSDKYWFMKRDGWYVDRTHS
ncbi:gp062R [Rabbit fibroma virus]|uniref:Probable host range protein 2-1 n=1 Tax=Rabbit fibroma virus (strain Kasza) TaxID=10272 RepID=VH21_RFVKA|nr:gp062R [Rabbit fibroma virus]Q9Q909.1 RecName: Full=Probable host range protein 2-1 [Rabbit fibroma virus (strain Kasza)]AAF17944.1 gp062R [Rabbit fibroma virus]